MWGDYYLDAKLKRVKRGAFSTGKKPMFVQMILDNIWSVYDAIMVRKDKEQSEKIVKSLNLTISQRDVKHQDCRIYLQAVCQQWLPSAGSVLSAVCGKLPSPRPLSDERAERLMLSKLDDETNAGSSSLPEESKQLKSCFVECSSDHGRPTIVFVSKMFAVETKQLETRKKLQKPMTDEELRERRKQIIEKQVRFDDKPTEVAIDEREAPCKNDFTFLAFARVFSGTLHKGQQLYVLPPTHDPFSAAKSPDYVNNLIKFQLSDLYLMLGRELEPLERVPAGNIAAIGGLEEFILKSATLSDTPLCPAFGNLKFYAEPIVRVSIEPKHAGDMPALISGLRLLDRADPCVKTYVEDTGEHVLVTAGEVHLQRCLADLADRYSKIELNVSEPIIPFMETIVPRPVLDRVNETIQSTSDDTPVKHTVEIKTSNKQVLFKIRAQPLPETVLK